MSLWQNRSVRTAFSLGLLLLLAGVLFAPARLVNAAEPVAPAVQPKVQTGTTPIPPAPTPGPTPSESTPTPPPPGSTITENIFHIISFPFETMTDAVVQMSNKIILKSYDESGKVYESPLDELIYGRYGIAPREVGSGATDLTPLFKNLILPHWKVTLALAIALLPLTLTLTCVSALRGGADSALAYADLRKALIGWFAFTGGSAGSYFLLGLAHRLSTASALLVLQADFGERVTPTTLVTAFFNVKMLHDVIQSNPLTAPIVLYVGLFVLFLSSMCIIGLLLALAAVTAMIYLLTAIAPIVLILCSLPPLRWLYALWLKVITVTFLLPLFNAFLIKAAVSMSVEFINAQGQGNWGAFFSALFITLGIISVLITIDFKVAEFVYGGALGEAHRQAKDATMGIMSLGVGALGLVAGLGLGAAAIGGAAGSAAGGAAASGAVAGGGGPPAAGGAAATAEAGAASSSAGGGGPATGISSRLGGIGERIGQFAAQFTGNSGQGGNGQGSDGGGVPDSSPGGGAGSATAADDQKRRSQLAGDFGRALSLGSRNPLVHGAGTGLQLAGAVGNYGAGQAQDTQRATTQTDRQLNDAMNWSRRSFAGVPNDVFDLSRDNTAMMTGALHQGLLNNQDTPRATNMRDLLPVTQGSYGAWLAQGRPGGVEAQREYFDAVFDDRNATTPNNLIGGLNQWAEKHGVQMDPGLPQTVTQAYDQGEPVIRRRSI